MLFLHAQAGLCNYMLDHPTWCWYGCSVTDEAEPWDWDWWGYEANFANQMRERRERKGWSQTEMARRLSEEGLKFHQTTVQRVEIGRRPLKLTEAFVIARVLGARFEVMLHGESIEIAYEALADSVSAGSFDDLASSIDRLDVEVRRNSQMIQELVQQYTKAVATVAEAKANQPLLETAAHYVEISTELEKETRSLARHMRLARKAFDSHDRDYPSRYQDEPSSDLS